MEHPNEKLQIDQDRKDRPEERYNGSDAKSSEFAGDLGKSTFASPRAIAQALFIHNNQVLLMLKIQEQEYENKNLQHLSEAMYQIATIDISKLDNNTQQNIGRILENLQSKFGNTNQIMATLKLDNPKNIQDSIAKIASIPGMAKLFAKYKTKENTYADILVMISKTKFEELHNIIKNAPNIQENNQTHSTTQKQSLQR